MSNPYAPGQNQPFGPKDTPDNKPVPLSQANPYSPGYTQPQYQGTQPNAASSQPQPGTVQPGTAQPGTVQPGAAQPGTAQPVAAQPAQYYAYTQPVIYTQPVVMANPLPQPPRSNETATIALILSLVGLVTWISAPIGAVMGHIALSEINRTGQIGDGQAKAAIIIGWIITALPFVIVLIILLAIAGASS